MSNIKRKYLSKVGLVKTYFNRKSVRNLLQLVIFAIIFYCATDNGLINEFRSILDFYDIKETNKIIMEIVLPLKSLIESVEVINLFYIVFKVLVAIVVFPLVFLFFCVTISRIKDIKHRRRYTSYKDTTSDVEAVYILQKKFLC